jgi:hypothetical protein
MSFPATANALFVWALLVGGQPDRNFPPKGSETLSLANFNHHSVRLALTVEPFSDGVEYPGGSKTITIEIAPDGH